jgi:hypothetical protein
VSYFGGVLYGFFGPQRLIGAGLVCAGVARALLAIFGPGAGWLAFHGSLMLLGIGVGAVIPTVSSRAIEAAGMEARQPRERNRFHVSVGRGRGHARRGHGDILID